MVLLKVKVEVQPTEPNEGVLEEKKGEEHSEDVARGLRINARRPIRQASSEQRTSTTTTPRVRAHALRLHLNRIHRSKMKVCGSL